MRIDNNFIFKLKDRLGELLIIPLGESDFSIQYERQTDGKASYKKNLDGKIVLIKEAFRRIMEMEGSIYRCDEQTIEVYKNCPEEQLKVFEGRISLNEADFDLDGCIVEVKFLEESIDRCIEDNKDEKYNAFYLTGQRITVQPIQVGGGVYEYRECVKSNYVMQGQSYGLAAWCTASPNTGIYDISEALANNWIIISNLVRMDGSISQNPNPDPDPSQGGGMLSLRTKWIREIVEIDCSDIPSSDWILIEDNCPTGKKKYAKKADLYDCRYDFQIYTDNWNFSYFNNCKIIGDSGNTGTIPNIDNGIHLNEIIKELIRLACPDLIVKSDFFQINPENPSSTNYVTLQPSTVNNIIVFQKSDVKRPNDYNNAQKMEITLDDLLELLITMFNVRWRIESGNFIIEHVSRFQKTLGFNLTVEPLKKYFAGFRKYSYESVKIPKKEIFDFKERSNNPDWSLEVEYKGCVTNRDKKNIVTNMVDIAMTDVLWAYSNNSSGSNVVSDTGIFLISTNKQGSNYYINSEDSPNGRILNNVFAWYQLFRDFHHYERPMKNGFVNGVNTEFETTIPTKKGETFSIPINLCKKDFDIDKKILTGLGEGIVSSAKYRFEDNFIELSLLYESNQDLVLNNPPTLTGGGTFSVVKNTSRIFDLVATDSDGTITALQVVNQPINGVVNVLSTSQIEYIPDTDYIGVEFFSVQALDNLTENSNLVQFLVNVRLDNQLPVAEDDYFEMLAGDPFVQNISIFNNDYDDIGFQLVDDTLTTNEGINITIDSNGFFDYTPPVGFIGVDYFDYEIKDDLNNFSSARVTITVRALNLPIAVEDHFQTLKNNTFSNVIPAIGHENLFDNDYTPDGTGYSYTSNIENKSTLSGGTVQINNDGTFTYNPPTDFIGVDQFEYTVNNLNGSGTGIVKISVLPLLYVKLSVIDLKNNGLVIECGNPPQSEIGGNQRTNDIILTFFSDSGKTIPFDVTGLNMRAIVSETLTTTNVGSPSSSVTTNFETGILNGSSYIVYDDYETYRQERNCSFQITTTASTSFALINNGYEQ